MRIRKKSLQELDLDSLTEIRLSSEDEHNLAKGIELFNCGRFWEAHEAWEEIWQRHPEDARFFIQALIQLAAAYHQLLRKVHRGFLIHIRRARERLALFPDIFLGIDVGTLRAAVNQTVGTLDTQKNSEEMNFSQIEIPRITSLPSRHEPGSSEQ
jgi:predicted metal-dependent hydrolase